MSRLVSVKASAFGGSMVNKTFQNAKYCVRSATADTEGESGRATREFAPGRRRKRMTLERESERAVAAREGNISVLRRAEPLYERRYGRPDTRHRATLPR